MGVEPEHNPMSQITSYFNSWSKADVQYFEQLTLYILTSSTSTSEVKWNTHMSNFKWSEVNQSEVRLTLSEVKWSEVNFMYLVNIY